MSVVIFAIARLLPGDPTVTILGEQATPEQRQRVRQELWLDEPLPLQYGYWVVQVAQGDFGRSLRSSESVSVMIRDRAPVTLELTFFLHDPFNPDRRTDGDYCGDTARYAN